MHSMILGFPRFPRHWRNLGTCVEIKHFQWFWAPRASHFTEQIMKNAWSLCIFNDSGLPTLPIPPKKSKTNVRKLCIFNDSGLPRFPPRRRTCTNVKKAMHFEWFWASHASHFTEEIMEMYGNLCIFNDFWLPTLPTPRKKSWKIHGNQCIFNDSGLPTALENPRFPLNRTHYQKCMDIYALSMILGFPRFLLHWRNL